MPDQQRGDELPGAVVTAGEAERLAPELGATPEAVRAHLALMPPRYAAAVPARALVRHTLMAATPPGRHEVRTRVTPGGDEAAQPGVLDELDVVAIDHPGWCAKVAGVVALNGGSILAADAFARTDGLSVDTFRVAKPEGAAGSWWARVEGDLAEAAAGKLAIRARVMREARRERRRLAHRPAAATKVAIERDPAGGGTVIEVRTLDRIGVLYSIAAALAELELDIVVARVQTVGHEVVDAFHVRDAQTRPLDADHAAEVELAITAAVDEL